MKLGHCLALVGIICTLYACASSEEDETQAPVTKDGGKATDSGKTPGDSGEEPPDEPIDAGKTDAGKADAEAGTPLTCGSLGACASPTNLGTIRGDTGNDIQMTTGSGVGGWYTVHVDEGSKDSLPMTVSAAVNIASSDINAGSVYTVKLYGEVKPTCSSLGKVTANPLTWPDTSGNEDARDPIIAVEHTSGPCCPFTLVIQRF